jgi:hypothetical protein
VSYGAGENCNNLRLTGLIKLWYCDEEIACGRGRTVEGQNMFVNEEKTSKA